MWLQKRALSGLARSVALRPANTVLLQHSGYASRRKFANLTEAVAQGVSTVTVEVEAGDQVHTPLGDLEKPVLKVPTVTLELSEEEISNDLEEQTEVLESSTPAVDATATSNSELEVEKEVGQDSSILDAVEEVEDAIPKERLPPSGRNVSELIAEYQQQGVPPSDADLVENLFRFLDLPEGETLFNSRVAQFDPVTLCEAVDKARPEFMKWCTDPSRYKCALNLVKAATPAQKFVLGQGFEGQFLQSCFQEHPAEVMIAILEGVVTMQRNYLIYEVLENIEGIAESPHGQKVIECVVKHIVVEVLHASEEESKVLREQCQEFGVVSSDVILRKLENMVAFDSFAWARKMPSLVILLIGDKTTMHRSKDVQLIVTTMRNWWMKCVRYQKSCMVLLHVWNLLEPEQIKEQNNVILNRLIATLFSDYGRFFVVHLLSCSDEMDLNKLIRQMLSPSAENKSELKAVHERDMFYNVNFLSLSPIEKIFLHHKAYIVGIELLSHLQPAMKREIKERMEKHFTPLRQSNVFRSDILLVLRALGES